jgi:DNA-binding transcriptional LysR family regulator
MVSEARAAYERVARARAKPSGMVRMSCSTVLAQLLISPLIPLFTEKNPEVRIALEASDRKIDIEENFDLSIRIRQAPAEDSQMIMRSLGTIQQVLVASASFLKQHGRPTSPSQASQLPTISYGALQGPHVWKLIDSEEREVSVRHEPKLISDDMVLIRQAAVQGVGIVQLPLSVCLQEIQQDLLEVVLPEYSAPLCDIQLVFPSRRGMLPAVRCVIDFLSAHCGKQVEAWQVNQHTGGRVQQNLYWPGARQRVA